MPDKIQWLCASPKVSTGLLTVLLYWQLSVDSYWSIKAAIMNKSRMCNYIFSDKVKVHFSSFTKTYFWFVGTRALYFVHKTHRRLEFCYAGLYIIYQKYGLCELFCMLSYVVSLLSFIFFNNGAHFLNFVFFFFFFRCKWFP